MSAAWLGTRRFLSSPSTCSHQDSWDLFAQYLRRKQEDKLLVQPPCSLSTEKEKEQNGTEPPNVGRDRASVFAHRWILQREVTRWGRIVGKLLLKWELKATSFNQWKKNQGWMELLGPGWLRQRQTKTSTSLLNLESQPVWKHPGLSSTQESVRCNLSGRGHQGTPNSCHFAAQRPGWNQVDQGT